MDDESDDTVEGHECCFRCPRAANYEWKCTCDGGPRAGPNYLCEICVLQPCPVCKRPANPNYKRTLSTRAPSSSLSDAGMDDESGDTVEGHECCFRCLRAANYEWKCTCGGGPRAGPNYLCKICVLQPCPVCKRSEDPNYKRTLSTWAPSSSLSDASFEQDASLKVDDPVSVQYELRALILDMLSNTTTPLTSQDIVDKRTCCFVPKTFFKSVDGSLIEVSGLTKGAHVLAECGEVLEVCHVGRTEQDLQQLVEIVTCQSRLIVTESHRLVVENDGEHGSTRELVAKDLQKETMVYCSGGAVEVLEVRRFEQKTEVFDIAFFPDKLVECFLLDQPAILTKGSVARKRQTRRGGMKKRLQTFPDTDEELTFGGPSQM